jgi:hypothetical protein
MANRNLSKEELELTLHHCHHIGVLDLGAFSAQVGNKTWNCRR